MSYIKQSINASQQSQTTKPQIVTFPVDSPKPAIVPDKKQLAQQQRQEAVKHKGEACIVQCSGDLSKEIQKARMKIEPPMSQKDLDHKCNFPPNTIKNYECGKANVNSQQLNTIEKHLGVKLPRPSKNSIKYES